MRITDPIFTDDEKARKFFEAHRWPDGPVCPHCGNAGRDRNTALTGKNHRSGLYQCNECREQFTVTVGTVFERSHVPLNKWLLATFLLSAGKKGTSAHQLHRIIGVTYKTAWFMFHRIREAMRQEGLSPLGGGGGIVEADETYFGQVEKAQRRTKTTSGRPFTKSGRPGPSNKRAIVSLVERGGKVRSFHVATADKETVNQIVSENIAAETRLHTDESRLYSDAKHIFAAHEAVKHSRKEYVRGDVHTNSVEGYFSIFKRGMKGNYQHCKEKHLHRYLAEFDFRYNHRIALGFNDAQRTGIAIKGAEGKRLMYRRPH